MCNTLSYLLDSGCRTNRFRRSKAASNRFPELFKPTIEIRKFKPNDSHVNNFNRSILCVCVYICCARVKSHKRDERFIRCQCDYKLWRFEHNLILRLEMFQRLSVSLENCWAMMLAPGLNAVTTIETCFLLSTIKLILQQWQKVSFNATNEQPADWWQNVIRFGCSVRSHKTCQILQKIWTKFQRTCKVSILNEIDGHFPLTALYNSFSSIFFSLFASWITRILYAHTKSWTNQTLLVGLQALKIRWKALKLR